jgi:hypothetical protein
MSWAKIFNILQIFSRLNIKKDYFSLFYIVEYINFTWYNNLNFVYDVNVRYNKKLEVR